MVMAYRALSLSLPRPSDLNFPCFSYPLLWRFQNPRFTFSHSSLLHLSSPAATLLIPVNFSPSAPLSFINNRSGGVAGEEEADFGRYGRKGRKCWKRRRKRRWRWEELLEDDYDEDNDDNGGEDGDLWPIVEQVIDNVWIFKVFKSYGYLLPFIIISFLSATGPKAFLTTLAIASVPSLLFLVFQKLTAQNKPRRRSNLGSEEEDKRRSRKVGYYYSSRFRSNEPDGPAGVSSGFGGWDQLDNIGSVAEPSGVKNEPQRNSYKRVRVEEGEPLMLRYLVSTFPFLSSWINMLR